ncbi:DUF4124 domain-containing protein [uncultured Thiohalocapsa sp.]|uniref:DUF4124 domain-containing protein n=1 Tax=uncultured Thiohalocapsa sp. TaxID=768990 RepID=UPI0025FB1C75|nr:DUF4124 domain-containing protein [uncultured Thiohalocapsa sp.]
MVHRAVTAGTGGLLLAAGIAGAQVYKGVDADGNVVYSSSPAVGADPERVEQVRIDPGPTDADRAAAERRMRAMQPRGGPSQPPTPGQQTQQQTPAQAAPQQNAGGTQSYDWLKQESTQRGGSTSRTQRSPGESRSRSGTGNDAERTTR